MEENKYHSITITKETGEKLDLTVDWDADIWKWGHLFRVILQWISFDNELIDEILVSNEDLLNNSD